MSDGNGVIFAGLALAASLMVTARVRRRAAAKLSTAHDEFERRIAVERDAADMAAQHLAGARSRISALQEELEKIRARLREVEQARRETALQLTHSEQEKFAAVAYAAGCVAGAGARSKKAPPASKTSEMAFRPRLRELSNLLEVA